MKCLSWFGRLPVAAIGFVVLSGLGIAAAIGSKDFGSGDLFQSTNLWNAHFIFTAEQWDAMEPKGEMRSFQEIFGGGRGGVRAPDSGMLLAPAFLKAGDRDGDNQLSQAEFTALGERWFSDWDTNKTGALKAEQIRAGLDAVLGTLDLALAGMPGANGGGLLQAREGKRNGLASLMGIEFDYVHAEIEFENQHFKDIAVRYKGNGTFVESRASLKHSLKVDLNEFAKGQRLAGRSKLNFHNNVADSSLMNEALAFALFRDAGVPAPRTAYARVFVTVPGKHEHRYFGLYSLVENIDGDFADAHYGSGKAAILKPSTASPFTDLGDDWKKYMQPYDPKTELTSAQKQRVMEFCKLVSHAKDDEFAAQVASYLDMDEFARFMAVTVYLSSLDSILGTGQNYYVILQPTTQRFQFIPWDQDRSFADFLGAGGPPGSLSIHHPWRGEVRFLERVFKVEAFKKLYLAKLDELTRTICQSERFRREVDRIAAAIRGAVSEESEERLSRFDKAVAGETTSPPGLGGLLVSILGFPSRPARAFVEVRNRSVTDQLAGIAQGKLPGSSPFGGAGRGGWPGNFNLGSSVTGALMAALDQDKDGSLNRDEFRQGFANWYKAWTAEPGGALTEEQLRAGINKDLPLPSARGIFGFPSGPPAQAQ